MEQNIFFEALAVSNVRIIAGSSVDILELLPDDRLFCQTGRVLL